MRDNIASGRKIVNRKPWSADLDFPQVLAVVHGPREPARRGEREHDEAVINVDFRYAHSYLEILEIDCLRLLFARHL